MADISLSRRSTLRLGDAVTAERDALAAQNKRLRHMLLKPRRRQFGRKSEQLPIDLGAALSGLWAVKGE